MKITWDTMRNEMSMQRRDNKKIKIAMADLKTSYGINKATNT